MIPEKDKINIINNIKTSMEMESQVLTLADIAMLNNFADDKITMEAAIQEIKSQFYNI